MNIPPAFNPPDLKNAGDYALQFHKSLYGLKQSAHNWFQTLKFSLQQRKFKQSQSEPCLFYRNDAIIVIYVDDCIIFTPPNSKICQDILQSLQNGNEHFQFTNQGSLHSYLGVSIQKSSSNNQNNSEKSSVFSSTAH